MSSPWESSSDPVTAIHAATEKEPVDADEFLLVDSEDDWRSKKITFIGLIAALESFFVLSGGQVSSQTIIGGTSVFGKLRLQGTNVNGTSTSPAVECAVGNNGATIALTVLNNGKIGINNTSPATRLHVVHAGEQLRLGYDATKYVSNTVDLSGNLTLDTTGGTIFTPDTLENTTAGAGIILKSPDGTRYKLTVANGGTLSITAA